MCFVMLLQICLCIILGSLEKWFTVGLRWRRTCRHQLTLIDDQLQHSTDRVHRCKEKMVEVSYMLYMCSSDLLNTSESLKTLIFMVSKTHLYFPSMRSPSTHTMNEGCV